MSYGGEEEGGTGLNLEEFNTLAASFNESAEALKREMADARRKFMVAGDDVQSGDGTGEEGAGGGGGSESDEETRHYNPFTGEMSLSTVAGEEEGAGEGGEDGAGVGLGLGDAESEGVTAFSPVSEDVVDGSAGSESPAESLSSVSEVSGPASLGPQAEIDEEAGAGTEAGRGARAGDESRWDRDVEVRYPHYPPARGYVVQRSPAPGLGAPRPVAWVDERDGQMRYSPFGQAHVRFPRTGESTPAPAARLGSALDDVYYVGEESPARAAAVSSVAGVDFGAISRRLRENGFAGVRNSGPDAGPAGSPRTGAPGGGGPSPQDVAESLLDVLEGFERRSRLVEELQRVAAAAEKRSGVANPGYSITVQRHEARIAELQVQLAMAREQTGRETQHMTEKERNFHVEIGRLKQKVTQAEHQARAREAEAAKLKDRLQDLVAREARREAKANEVAQKSSAKKGPKPGAAEREIAAAFEVQRLRMESDLVHMRREVAELTMALKEKENETILSRANARGSAVNEAWAERVAEREANVREREVSVRRLEERSMDRLEEMEGRLRGAERRAERLAEEKADLVLEVAGRPTTTQYKTAQAEIEALKKHVLELASGKENQSRAANGDGDDDALRRKRVTSGDREAIRRDRDLMRLRLHGLEKMAKADLVFYLQDVCRLLELSDPDDVSSTLAKLLRVIGAVPRMERFVTDVCDTVFGSEFGRVDVSRRVPDTVVPTLRSWIDTMYEGKRFKELRAVISMELAARYPEALGAQPTAVAGLRSDEEIAVALRRLVETEKNYIVAMGNLKAAQIYTDAHPDEVSIKILNFVKNLFDIKQLEGVIPSLTVVARRIAAHENFLRVFKSLTGVPSNASHNDCIKWVHRALDGEGRKKYLKKEYLHNVDMLPAEVGQGDDEGTGAPTAGAGPDQAGGESTSRAETGGSLIVA